MLSPRHWNGQSCAGSSEKHQGNGKIRRRQADICLRQRQQVVDVANPEALKDHDGHHVEVSAHVYADKGQIHVMSVKMVKAAKSDSMAK